jgi:hypothetical protein
MIRNYFENISQVLAQASRKDAKGQRHQLVAGISLPLCVKL